jgi:hypothetical protein
MVTYINEAKAEGVKICVVEDGAVVHLNGAAERVREMLPIITPSHLPTSPDLNSIEQCWQVVKARLTAMERHATALDELWENVARIWDDIPQSTIDGFIMEMEERRKLVIDACGNQIQG